MTETNGEDRALPGMPESPKGLRTLTCAQVEAGDFEARYLANRLDRAEAEAYEAHYFGCDRCWTSLRRATEVRAAFASSATARRGLGWMRWALPAAAVLAAIGVWQLADRSPVIPPVAMRGGADSLTVTVVTSPDSLRAVWPRQADADAYRVRGFRPDGALLWNVEVQDTTIATRRSGAVLIDVAALDRTRAVIAQSALVRVE